MFSQLNNVITIFDFLHGTGCSDLVWWLVNFVPVDGVFTDVFVKLYINSLPISFRFVTEYKVNFDHPQRS